MRTMFFLKNQITISSFFRSSFMVIILVMLLPEINAQKVKDCWDEWGPVYVNVPEMTVQNSVQKSGWNLIFDEEFSSPISNSKWDLTKRGDDCDSLGTGFSPNPDNVYVRQFPINPEKNNLFVSPGDGYAVIANTLVSCQTGCYPQHPYNPRPYSAGGIQTFRVCSEYSDPTYNLFGNYYFYDEGYMEARVKLFNKIGQGSSMWLWSNNTYESQAQFGSDTWNEIDVFEQHWDLAVDNLFKGTYIYQDLQCKPSNSHYLTFDVYLHDLTVNKDYSLSNNWTTFGVKWNKDTIVWYVNNIPVYTMLMHTAGHDYPPPIWPFSPRFGTAGNYNADMEDPGSMKIDYIRIYKKTGYYACPIRTFYHMASDEQDPNFDNISYTDQPYICQSDTSFENSNRIIGTHYYPEAAYSWSSPGYPTSQDPPVFIFSPSRLPYENPQTPDKFKYWLNPNNTQIVSSKVYPVWLHVTFPWGYTESSLINILVGSPESGGSFLAHRISYTCYFEITNPAKQSTQGSDYSLDGGNSWNPCVLKTISGTNYWCFGCFNPDTQVSFSYREYNDCGYSPVTNKTLTMPPQPNPCGW